MISNIALLFSRKNHGIKKLYFACSKYRNRGLIFCITRNFKNVKIIPKSFSIYTDQTIRYSEHMYLREIMHTIYIVFKMFFYRYDNVRNFKNRVKIPR